jgi:hypothetical protein
MEDNLILARLEESIEIKPTLFEARGGMNLKFKFAESDIVNANKRKYPHKVLSDGIDEAQRKIEAGSSLFGSCDHQDVLHIADISHRLTKLEMKSKEGWCEAAVLKTVRGNDLIEIIKGGGRVGASMRGTGSVKEGVVQEDWRLQGVDMVLGPSFDVHVSQANVFESEELNPSLITENVEGRYVMALKAGFKGSLKQFQDGINAKGDDEKVGALFQGALKAGYKGTYLSYRTEYLKGRKS